MVEANCRWPQQDLGQQRLASNVCTYDTRTQHWACRLWRNLSFPKALYPLVTPAVLVETFEQGQLIHSFVDNPSNPHNAELANIGRDCFLKMLLNDNFIHAGTAPGLPDSCCATYDKLLSWQQQGYC